MRNILPDIFPYSPLFYSVKSSIKHPVNQHLIALRLNWLFCLVNELTAFQLLTWHQTHNYLITAY
jgi:hypothetical protein